MEADLGGLIARAASPSSLPAGVAALLRKKKRKKKETRAQRPQGSRILPAPPTSRGTTSRCLVPALAQRPAWTTASGTPPGRRPPVSQAGGRYRGLCAWRAPQAPPGAAPPACDLSRGFHRGWPLFGGGSTCLWAGPGAMASKCWDSGLSVSTISCHRGPRSSGPLPGAPPPPGDMVLSRLRPTL